MNGHKPSSDCRQPAPYLENTIRPWLLAVERQSYRMTSKAVLWTLAEFLPQAEWLVNFVR